MPHNINQNENHSQPYSGEVEKFAIFRFTHGLSKSVKSRIKALGCIWNVLYHGWLCPIPKQEAVQQVLQEAKLQSDPQIISLPKGMIPSDPRIANLQSRLEILEEQSYKEETKLLQDVCQYDDSLRPEDFAQLPTTEGKSMEQHCCEMNFYDRWVTLKKNRETIEELRQKLSYVNSDPEEKVLDSHAPLLIAETLIQDQFTLEENRTLQYCSDAFYRWDGIKYIELNIGAVRKIIYNFLKDAKTLSDRGCLENFNPNKFKVDQIMDALRAICHQDHHTANGSIWLDNRTTLNPKYLIAFKNGLLNIEDWLINSSSPLLPHTPLLLNVNALTFDFVPQAPEPQAWLQFLFDIWPVDLESQQTLQEWFGYLLVHDTQMHKILLIVGPPRSGKGTIGRILMMMLGAFNMAGPTLSSLGGEFGLQPLLNKMLALISDARLNGKGSNNVIIERLLSISGEDPLTINRKFLPPLTVQLSTRITMMSNELPDLRDASGALAKRYIVLTMTKSWLGNEDTSLLSRLIIELPGILLWSLQGLFRLQKRGKFIQPKSSTQTIEEIEAMTSPIKAFVLEKCELKLHALIAIDTLFKAWRLWCEATGYPSAGNIQSFGKHFRAAFPEIEVCRPQENLQRERCYRGITLIATLDLTADARGQSWNEFD